MLLLRNHGGRLAASVLLGAAALVAAPVGATLVLNEILVDPDGSDSGREYVELYNRGTGPISLEGVRFEFANGAEAPSWRTRWEGEAGQRLAAGERFLITDRNWQGTAVPQAEVYLGLQNGPDAVRLVRGAETLDLLGYGALTDAALFEGAAAPVATGRALARRPDGRDTGDNAADFVLADPTPGAPNFEDWLIEASAWRAEPPSLDRSGAEVEVTVEIRNAGLQTIAPSRVELAIGAQVVVGHLDALASGERCEATWRLRPVRTGTLPIRLRIPPPAVPETLGVALGSLQVGPGALVLSEILAAPDQDQGEWIELRARADSVLLAEFSLRDEDGDWRPLPDRILRSGERVVVAQDSLALAGWLCTNARQGWEPSCGLQAALGRIAVGPSPWPSLNNASASSRDFADRIWLADARQNVIDHLAWEGPGTAVVPAPPGGISLERIADLPRQPGASLWDACTAQAGSTPGCGNSLATEAGPGTGFRVEPRILDPGAGAPVLHARCELPPGAEGLQLRIYDLGGTRVRDLGSDRLGPGPRDLIWDGRDDQRREVPAGGYVFAATIRGAGGGILRRERQLVAVRRGGRR